MSGYRPHELGIGGSGVGQGNTAADQDPLIIRKQECHGFTLQLVLGKAVQYPSAGLVVATDGKFRSDTMGLHTLNNVPEWQEEEVGFPSRRELRNKFLGRTFDECHALSFTTNQDVGDEKVRLILINMADVNVVDDDDVLARRFEEFRRSIVACLEVANRGRCVSIALPVFGGPPMSHHLLDEDDRSIYQHLINSIWDYFLPTQVPGEDMGEAILRAARRRDNVKVVSIIIENRNIGGVDAVNEFRLWEVQERLVRLVDVWDNIFPDAGPQGPPGLDGRNGKDGRDGSDIEVGRNQGDETQEALAQPHSIEEDEEEEDDEAENTEKSRGNKRSGTAQNATRSKRAKGPEGKKPVQKAKSGPAPRERAQGRGRGGSVPAGQGDTGATGNINDCKGTTAKGARCKNKVGPGKERCHIHPIVR